MRSSDAPESAGMLGARLRLRQPRVAISGEIRQRRYSRQWRESATDQGNGGPAISLNNHDFTLIWFVSSAPREPISQADAQSAFRHFEHSRKLFCFND